MKRQLLVEEGFQLSLIVNWKFPVQPEVILTLTWLSTYCLNTTYLEEAVIAHDGSCTDGGRDFAS